MRFMVFVKSSADSEAGVMPSAEAIERMGVYNNELIAAGVMLDAGGLRPSSHGARLSFENGQPMIIDGPFTETKELIGGYWIWQCKDLAEAIGWLRKAPYDVGALEIRPFYEPEDFKGIASEELIAQEKGWREDQAKTAMGQRG
ncbi:YciI family protein [Phenylobacterium sp.]|uniref:YciI family protein n=1 Tax=Phenylobacterium sp. TaxID=1871053 RepID=UPI001211A420|nr:YciI family protein [Phenylobacterium sp.]TAL31310.1 MAG: YciI family protein [Phenylobacterium sp.]